MAGRVADFFARPPKRYANGTPTNWTSAIAPIIVVRPIPISSP